MILKIVGSIAVAISSVLIAVSHRRFLDKRLRTLDGFISLIMYIKGQVDCYSLPLCEILVSIPPEILCNCNCPEGVESLDELVSESKIYLGDESLRLLEAFCIEFGSVFRAEQLRRCDFYIESLVEVRKTLADDVIKSGRVGSALSICSSLGLLILLW